MNNSLAQVRIQPVGEDDVRVIQELMGDPEALGEFEWSGWHDPHGWQRQWEENGLLGDEVGYFMVVLGEERLGIVNYRKKGTGPAAYCWEIGITLLPKARGQGYGTQAQRQLAEYLFAHTLANRVEAWTETGNVAERRSLEKAGFTQEGVRRGSAWRDGAWRDGVMYGILREETVG